MLAKLTVTGGFGVVVPWGTAGDALAFAPEVDNLAVAPAPRLVASYGHGLAPGHDGRLHDVRVWQKLSNGGSSSAS